jgi:hypothetical protein
MPFPARGVPFPSDRHRGLVGTSGMPAPPRQEEEHPAAQHDEADHAAQQGPFRALRSSVNNEEVFQGWDFRRPGITDDPKSASSSGSGPPPSAPSALIRLTRAPSPRMRSCSIDRPPSQLLNAARRPADSFDDARPATIVGRGSGYGRPRPDCARSAQPPLVPEAKTALDGPLPGGCAQECFRKLR